MRCTTSEAKVLRENNVGPDPVATPNRRAGSAGGVGGMQIRGGGMGGGMGGMGGGML